MGKVLWKMHHAVRSNPERSCQEKLFSQPGFRRRYIEDLYSSRQLCSEEDLFLSRAPQQNQVRVQQQVHELLRRFFS